MSDPSDLDRAASFWDRGHHEGITSWMENPVVRDYVNGRFEGEWPAQWFVRRLNGRRFRRALSVGCGTGSFERLLVQEGVCESVDAFDASIQSLASARAEAQAAGVGSRIRYFGADFNRPALPSAAYDLVVFHQSLHHVERIESLLAAVLKALQPDGILYLDEYVGPSRIDWTRGLLRGATNAHAEVPPDARVHDELLYPIQSDDPSEAIRSSDILGQLRVGFELDELRGYGGNIVAVLYPEVHWDRAPASLLPRLLELDAAAEARRGPYYAVIVARPRTGLARTIALARYAIAPQWRRYRWNRFFRPKALRVKLGIRRRLGLDARW